MELRYPYTLPPLPYAYDALIPHIGEETLHYHHDKHLQTYIDNLNKTLQDCPSCQKMSLDNLLRTLNCLPEYKRTPIRNNGGGVYNHILYFNCLSPKGGGTPTGMLGTALDMAFGSFEQWRSDMKNTALGVFGSGYAWLVSDRAGRLNIVYTANQDCPLTQGLHPLLCVDVWEHAYYLDVRNLRGEYIDHWFDVINWPYVQARYIANL